MPVRVIDTIEPRAGGNYPVVQADDVGELADRIAAGALTDEQRRDVNAIPALEDKTADLSVEVVARSWEDVTDLDEGGFVSNSSGNLGPSHASDLTYVLTKTATQTDNDNRYVYIRIPVGRDVRDYRIRQTFSTDEYFITSWSHVGTHEDFEYYRSRHNLFHNYVVTIQYDTVSAVQTHFRGVTDDVRTYDGHGAPVNAPGRLGQFDVNHTGRVWAAGDEQVTHTVAPSWSSDPTAVTTATWANWRGATRQTSIPTSDGQFHYAGLARRWILRDEDGTVTRFERWQDVLEFYYDNVNLQNSPPAGLLGTASKPSIFVAGNHVAFGDLADAAAHVAAAQLDADEVYVFFVGAPDDYLNWELHYAAANTFTAGTTLITEELHWRGPFLLQEDTTPLSDDDPENIGNAADSGDEAEASRDGHVHRFPHDSTIEYDVDNAQFGVSVHDVIEHLQESIWYYTSSPYDYSQGGGASEGEVYTTSDFHKRVTRIRFRFLPVPGARYEARIFRVHDDSRIHTLLGTSQFRTLDTGGSHHFNFEGSDGEAGILVPASTRIAIVLSRLGGGIVAANTGTESGDSPTESYDDASQDFVRQNSVVYSSENPAVDEHTHSHDDDIRGNIQISYSLTYNHGRFVGDNFDLSDALPEPVGTASAGDSDEASRSDHAHADSAMQQAAGSARVGEHTEVILWQYAATEPATPPFPWNETDMTFLADLGSWHATEAAALVARTNTAYALWVAYGGTDNFGTGGITNRGWSVFAVAAHQYSGDRGATNHATRQAADNAYRFLRPDGTWSAWLNLADNPYGFIGLLFAIDAYRTSSIDSRYSGLPAPGFDATNFSEMSLRLRAFGDYTSGDVPDEFGIEDTVILHRRGVDWSEFTDVTNDRETQAESTVKLRLDDVLGASAAWYGGGATNDELHDNIHSGVSGQPERRMSMNMNILVAANDANLIQGVSFHHFPDNWAKCIVDVGLR